MVFALIIFLFYENLAILTAYASLWEAPDFIYQMSNIASSTPPKLLLFKGLIYMLKLSPPSQSWTCVKPTMIGSGSQLHIVNEELQLVIAHLSSKQVVI